MLRSIFAIIGGYIAMAIGIMIATAVMARFMPGFVIANGQPSPDYIIVNLAYSAFFAVVGGYMAALIAGREPLKHAIILAVVCYLFFLLFLVAPTPPSVQGEQPTPPFWYKVGLLVVVGPAVTLGGFIRQRQTG